MLICTRLCWRFNGYRWIQKLWRFNTIDQTGWWLRVLYLLLKIQQDFKYCSFFPEWGDATKCLRRDFADFGITGSKKGGGDPHWPLRRGWRRQCSVGDCFFFSCCFTNCGHMVWTLTSLLARWSHLLITFIICEKFIFCCVPFRNIIIWFLKNKRIVFLKYVFKVALHLFRAYHSNHHP